MKKSRTVILLLLLFAFCLQVPAMAFTFGSVEDNTEEADTEVSSTDGPQYANTQILTAWLDTNGISYSVDGIDSSDFERISVDYIDVNGNTQYFVLFFYSDNELVSIYNWYLIDYDPANLNDVLYACNTMNSQYRYVRFYADESDNTVTSQIDIILREGESVLDMIIEGMDTLARISGYGYEEMANLDS